MERLPPEEQVYTPIFRKDIRSKMSLKLTFNRSLRLGNSSKITEWIMKYNHQSKIMAFYFLFCECYQVLVKATFDNLDELLNEMVEQTNKYHKNYLLKRSFKPGKASHWHTNSKPIHVKVGKGKFGIKQHGKVNIQNFQYHFPSYN